MLSGWENEGAQMTKHYFDTSIWLDYYEKRGKNGEVALDLILKIIDKDSIILYSDLVIREFKSLGYGIEQINNIFRIAKPDNLMRIHINREQEKEATKIASQKNIPRGDVLHALLARDNGAVMVSRDADFQKIKDIAETRKPEEIIKNV